MEWRSYLENVFRNISKPVKVSVLYSLLNQEAMYKGQCIVDALNKTGNMALSTERISNILSDESRKKTFSEGNFIIVLVYASSLDDPLFMQWVDMAIKSLTNNDNIKIIPIWFEAIPKLEEFDEVTEDYVRPLGRFHPIKGYEEAFVEELVKSINYQLSQN